MDLTLPQNASIFATEAAVQRLDAALAEDPDVDALDHLRRARRDPLLPAARTCSCPTPSSRRPWWSRRTSTARAAPAAAAREAARRAVPRRRRPRLAARARPAGRLAGAVPRQRAGHGRRCARSRCRSRASWRRNPGARHVNFDWIEPSRAAAHRRRPGPGAPARPELGGRRGGAQRGDRPAPPSRRCATTSTWSTWSRARPASERLSLDTLRIAAGAAPGRAHGGARASSRPSTTAQEYPLIWRRDRVPTLTVQADVAPGVLPDDVVAALEPPIAALNATLPAGYQHRARRHRRGERRSRRPR